MPAGVPGLDLLPTCVLELKSCGEPGKFEVAGSRIHLACADVAVYFRMYPEDSEYLLSSDFFPYVFGTAKRTRS